MLLTQNIGNSSCELIGSSNIASRITAFNTASGPSGANCATQGTTYQNNFNQLNTYGSQVITYINAYLSSPNLNNYLNSYFAYYNVVVNFMNAAIQSQFMSFIMPYMQLYQGSSCAFVTGSLGNISYTACNSVFTYLNALSIVTIVLSVCVFILMVLSYFMSTRM